MPWMPFVLKYWRVGLWAALVLAVALMGWRISAWREAYKALPAAQEALQAEIACGEGSECMKRALAAQAQAEAASQVILRGYEDELEALRNRPVRVRTVRLCQPADSGDVRVPDPAGPVDGTGPGTGVVHGTAGPDIGADLYRLARDADEIAARLRAIQQWNQALAHPVQ